MTENEAILEQLREQARKVKQEFELLRSAAEVIESLLDDQYERQRELQRLRDELTKFHRDKIGLGR